MGSTGTAGHGDWECGGSQKPPSLGHSVYLKQFLSETKDYGRKSVVNNNNVGKSSKGSNNKSKGAGGMLALNGVRQHLLRFMKHSSRSGIKGTV